MSSVAHPSGTNGPGPEAGGGDAGDGAGEVEGVGVNLTEQSKTCSEGGGFETERWWLRINDGWMTLSQVAFRGSVGGVAAELLDEDDPCGAGRGKWGDRPPQVYFRRRFHVTAPVGTRLLRRVWKPVVDRSKGVWDYIASGELSPGQRRFDEDFEVVDEDRIVSARALERARAARAGRGPRGTQTREAESRGPVLSREEHRRMAAELAGKLGREAAAGSAVTAGAEAPEQAAERGAAPSEGPARRREPVRQSESPGRAGASETRKPRVA